ncbi:hypothetical protein AA0482_0613 [Acetobacter cibinongensis NRIC 0482]|nr:hypothetical protein AA0482_0613 [Acetobacter cibinongensis NRIC 0482]
MIIMGTAQALVGAMQTAGCGRSSHARCHRAGRPVMGHGITVGRDAPQTIMAFVTMEVAPTVGGRTGPVGPAVHAS